MKSFKVPADEYFYSILHSHMHCNFNFFNLFCLQVMKPFGSRWMMIPIVLLILISAGHADNTAMNPEDLAQKMADQLNGKTKYSIIIELTLYLHFKSMQMNVVVLNSMPLSFISIYACYPSALYTVTFVVSTFQQ